jgi:hypothetical protein
MVWVIVFAGIALAGLVMLICYAVWLAHKTSDVWSEVSMLADRADELAQLVGQIRVPEPTLQADLPDDRTVYGQIDDVAAT